jgi:hypothetical protein
MQRRHRLKVSQLPFAVRSSLIVVCQQPNVDGGQILSRLL